MTAVARKVGEPADTNSGQVVVPLVPKMQAIEAALKACERGDCQPQDVAVAAYLVSNIDRATGECARHYETIATGCGMSRSAAGRSIKRLVDAGVIERAPRFARNRGQIATAFKIGAHILEGILERSSGRPRPTGRTRPSHKRDTNGSSSRISQFPIGVPGQPAKPESADWEHTAEWLYKAGQYRKHGFGADSLARDDLDRWRKEKGDVAMLKAIATAQAKRLYGDLLLDFLENTWPAKGRKSNVRPHVAGASLGPS